MSTGLTKKVLRISILAFILLLATSIISTTLVMGLTDFDQSKQLQDGYEEAFTHTVENYKNQRFTIEITLEETVSNNSIVYVFVVPRDDWSRIRDNASLGISDIPAENFLYNESVEKVYFDIDDKTVLVTLVGENIVIPDWNPWTMIFLNLNGEELSSSIKVEHQHILWWLWIVIPSLIITGLITYGVVENVTRYERVKMSSEKAIKKLGIKNEAERQRAAYWLISNGTEDDLAQLIELLSNENPLNRANAAFAIGGISKRIGDKSLGRVLIDQYNVDIDEMVKGEIVNAMCDVADESALEILEQYLKFEHNEILRFNIAEALEVIASHKSIPSLVEIINGNNTETLKIVCKRALTKIAKIEGTSADALIKKHSK